MSKSLRLFASAAALLLGLLGSSVAFAGTGSAAELGTAPSVPGNSAQVSHYAPAAHVPASARTTTIGSDRVHPNAQFQCQVFFVSPFEAILICNVTSGQLSIIGNCADGSHIQTPFFGPPGANVDIVCGSGLVSVQAATMG